MSGTAIVFVGLGVVALAIALGSLLGRTSRGGGSADSGTGLYVADVGYGDGDDNEADHSNASGGGEGGDGGDGGGGH